MGIFEKLELKEVVELLKNFNEKINSKSDLIPESLIAKCQDKKYHIEKHFIKNWNLFEIGEIDISYEEIIGQLFYKLKVDDRSMVLVVLDSSFLNNECYQVNLSGLIDLAEHHTSEYENSDFFGPFDHLFFLIDKNALIILHHEGVVITIQRS